MVRAQTMRDRWPRQHRSGGVEVDWVEGDQDIVGFQIIVEVAGLVGYAQQVHELLKDVFYLSPGM